VFHVWRDYWLKIQYSVSAGSNALKAKVPNEDNVDGAISKLYSTPSASCRASNVQDVRRTHAADAPRTSCLLAFVNRERTAESSSVATSKIPIQTALLVFALMLLNAELT